MDGGCLVLVLVEEALRRVVRGVRHERRIPEVEWLLVLEALFDEIEDRVEALAPDGQTFVAMSATASGVTVGHAVGEATTAMVALPPLAGLMTDVPLLGQQSRECRGLVNVGDHFFAEFLELWTPGQGRVVRGDLVLVWKEASDHRREAGPTEARRDIAMSKGETFACEFVDMGSLDVGMIHERIIIPGLVVANDHDHIGWRGIDADGSGEDQTRQEREEATSHGDQFSVEDRALGVALYDMGEAVTRIGWPVWYDQVQIETTITTCFFFDLDLTSNLQPAKLYKITLVRRLCMSQQQFKTTFFVIVSVIVGVASAMLVRFAFDRSSVVADNQDQIHVDLGLVVESGSLELGTIWESLTHVHDLTVLNQSNKPIHIIGWESTCNCATVVPDSIVVPASSCVSIQVNIDFSIKAPAAIEQGQSWKFQVRLTPLVQGANEALRGPDWVLHGDVRRLLHVDSLTQYIGVCSEDALPAIAEFDVFTAHPLARLEVDQDLLVSGWRVDICAKQNPERYSVLVQTPERLGLGMADCRVRLIPVSESREEDLPFKDVQVRGEICQDIVARPSTVMLGAGEIGSYIEEHFYLESLTEKTITDEQVIVNGEGVSVESVHREKDKCLYSVTQKILLEGEQTNFVTFVIKSALGVRDEIRVVLPVRYYGLKKSASQN